jgi:flagellar basal-body rod protein FlgB
MNLIDPVTLTLASRALDAASQRHAVHANNIANAHAEGFAPGRVSFEEHIAQVRDTLDSGAPLTLADVAQLPIGVELAAAGTPVAVENEVAALARNTLHYQALLKAVDRQLGLVSLAVSDGRR